MLALVLQDGPRLERDYPAPKRREGEALIRMRRCGVCDTDLQLARGYMGFRGIPGHEFVGEVIEADSSRLVGQRVVADINAGCGKCRDCVENDGHHCAERTVLGILNRDGALAEYCTMPERCLVSVPADVSDDRAVFAEPLAAALHVVDELEGDRVTVVGDGKLGQLIVRALVAHGARVTLIGHHHEKLELARAAGAIALLESDPEIEGARAPLVVEATGSPSGLARAVALTEARGKLVLKTTVAGNISVDLAPVVVNELCIVGSRCGNIQAAIELLERQPLELSGLIAARFPLSRADQALALAGKKGTLKVLVEGTSAT